MLLLYVSFLFETFETFVFSAHEQRKLKFQFRMRPFPLCCGLHPLTTPADLGRLISKFCIKLAKLESKSPLIKHPVFGVDVGAVEAIAFVLIVLLFNPGIEVLLFWG